MTRYHWTVNLTYAAEQLAGRIWQRRTRDGVTAGRWDEITAWTYRLRKAAERRRPLPPDA
jgi:hypothetical protein